MTYPFTFICQLLNDQCQSANISLTFDVSSNSYTNGISPPLAQQTGI